MRARVRGAGPRGKGSGKGGGRSSGKDSGKTVSKPGKEARMTRSTHGWARRGVAALTLVLASGTAWGQTFVYPQKGQSPQQQAQDQAECQAWATQQTGINPSMPQQMPMQASAPTASPLRGA